MSDAFLLGIMSMTEKQARKWLLGPYLSINQLDDVLLASEALQQGDLVHKALAGFRVLALQLDALQRKYLAVGRHHLCQADSLIQEAQLL